MRRTLSLGLACLAMAGCGGVATTDRPETDVTLLLGSRPSALHAGIYLAVERSFDEAEGVSVTIRRSGDPIRLLGNGRVQAALLEADQIRPANAVCVLAMRQRPEPGPFLCVLRTTLEDRRNEVQALVKTFQRGYSEAEFDPESAVGAEVTAVPSLDRATLLRELEALRADQTAGAPTFGYLDPDRFSAPDFDTTLIGPTSRD